MTEIFTLQNKKIWVAGHNGMVGSAVVRCLQKEGASEILTVSRQDLDLCCQASVTEWMAKNRPDIVVLAAAHVGGIVANRDYPAEFIYNNLAIETNIIHTAHKCGVEKLLFLGSSCVYPRETSQPITEEALLTGLLEPTNEAYAIAKIAGIKMCESYRKQYGCDFISAMPCNLYGPGDSFDTERSHVIPALLMKIHKAKIENTAEIVLWGTGKPLREFLHVDDLADALVFMLKHYSDTSHLNVGSGKEISIASLAEMVCNVTGYCGDVIFDKDKPDGTPRKLMDSSKLMDMGWSTSVEFKAGLSGVYEWYLEHHIKRCHAA